MPLTEAELRALMPRVLGAVVRRCGDFAAAEDAVQEALLAAHEHWPRDGAPDNPGGWLFRVAWRRLLDQRARDAAQKRREHERAERDRAENGGAEEADEVLHEDDTLVLLFTCCHPALTAPSAIALTLRAVGGLTTAEIARAFLVPEATMAQRITRAKATIAGSQRPFATPSAGERRERLAAVMQVLYLVFNEGHAGSSGEQVVRVDLSREAIRLVRELQRLLPDEAEVQGLLALMLLTDARRAARTGPNGELVTLDEQDRSRWDRAMIAEGGALLEAALRKNAVGSYQLQAAIAALHDEAMDFASTDWPQILMLYDLLRRCADNPMVELGRAVALAMVHGPAAGLARVDELADDPRLVTSHRLDAVRGHLLELAGDRAAARRCYLAAAARTNSAPEQNHLILKAARLGDGVQRD